MQGCFHFPTFGTFASEGADLLLLLDLAHATIAYIDRCALWLRFPASIAEESFSSKVFNHALLRLKSTYEWLGKE